jgi:hypothetical protein
VIEAENSLRVFVYVVLKNNKKSDWLNLCISTEDNNQTTVAAIAKRRLAQDKTFGYLGYSVSSPLMHLTSGGSRARGLRTNISDLS